MQGKQATMLQPDQMVGPYRIIRQIGQGGMATVYQAYHERLDRPVAVKVMHQALLQDPTFLTRFEREAKIIARLDHPHIVPVYDYSEIDGQPYLVMKYVEGRTLKQTLIKRALTIEEILDILTPIGNALDYAHQMGVLHRDIKPSNIILDGRDTPYLTDFGMARMAQAGDSTISTDMMLGTPQYISPEQALGKTDLDARTDLYSLGVVLYEVIVGQVPFSGDTPYSVIHDHIYRPLPLPTAINPEVPRPVEQVLVKALSKEPAKRFQSARELMDALRQAIQVAGLQELDPDRQAKAGDSLARLRGGLSATPAPIPSPLSDLTPPTAALPPDVEPPRKTKIEFSVDLGSDELQSELRRAGSEIGDAFREVGGQVRSAIRKQQFASEDWRRYWRSFADEIETHVGSGGGMPYDQEDAIRQRVEKSIKRRNDFVGHLSSFIIVNGILWLIYLGSAGLDLGSLIGQNLQGINFAFPWPLLVTCFWGAGLLADIADTYYNTGDRLRRRDQAVQREMRRLYGEDWLSTVREGDFKKVRKRIEKPWKDRQDLLGHIGAYIGVNAGLWSIFALSGMGFPWPIFVSFFWGIGLVADIAEKSRSGANQRAVEREVERERQRLMDEEEKPKRKRGAIRLTEDGELTDSMIDELDMEEKPKRSAR
ncbi:MAG: protein kinase [Anaerolineae bacterium]|nr:protein kinase [Anaerolineae bacterium]